MRMPARRQPLGEFDHLAINVRRNLRLEFYILVAGLLALWVTWTALQVGTERLREINLDSLKARVQWAATVHSKNTTSANISDPSMAAWADRLEEALEKQLLSQTGIDVSKNARMSLLQQRVNQLDGFALRRENAYAISVLVPYLSSTFPINAKALAKMEPFAVVVMLMVLFALRSRRRAYEILLSSLVIPTADRAQSVLTEAAAEFRTGVLIRRAQSEKTVWLFRMPIFLAPEAPMMWLLISVLVYGSVKMLIASGVVLGKSMFFNLYSLVFAAAVIGGLVVTKARSVYLQRVEEALGAPVQSYYWGGMMRAFQRAVTLAGRLQFVPSRMWVAMWVALGALGLASVFFRWAEMGNIHFLGFEFVSGQHPVAFIHSSLRSGISPPAFLPMQPEVFRDLRIVATVSILFLIASIALDAWTLISHRRSQRSASALKYAGWVVLALAAYLVSYLALLDAALKYGTGIEHEALSMVNGYFTAVFSNVFNASGHAATSGVIGGGFPLAFYMPCPWLWIYIGTCAVLAVRASVTGSGASKGRNEQLLFHPLGGREM